MVKDKFIFLDEIKVEVREIESLCDDLVLRLSLLSQKIRYIFSKIKLSDSIEEAQEYFNVLDTIQGALARLVFEHEIGIPDRLDRFVRDFDNPDYYIDYYFKKIKSGEYVF